MCEGRLRSGLITRAEEQLAQSTPRIPQVRFERDRVTQSFRSFHRLTERRQRQTQLIVRQSGARKSRRQGSQ